MDVKTAQQLFSEAGYYRASEDSEIGPATMAAVIRIEANAGDKRGFLWERPRRVIAAAQRVLAAQGHYRGDIDGVAGPKTASAVRAWRDAKGYVRPSVPPTVWPSRRNTTEMNALFGKPGSAQATEGRCLLPFPFVIAWDLDQRITSFACNKMAEGAFTSIFAESAKHYGEAEFRRLRLDRFGGCFADRKMRGSSTTTSTHAWGVAVDIDPENNQLKWGKGKAQLARPEYEPWWKIVESHGATSLGRKKDYDFMHFQLCSE